MNYTNLSSYKKQHRIRIVVWPLALRTGGPKTWSHDQVTPQTTAQPNCHRRACTHDRMTVCQDDQACSKCLLLQVFKNALIVGQLGSGPRLVDQIGSRVWVSAGFQKIAHIVGQVGSGVRVSDSFHILICAAVFAVVQSGFRNTPAYCVKNRAESGWKSLAVTKHVLFFFIFFYLYISCCTMLKTIAVLTVVQVPRIKTVPTDTTNKNYKYLYF